MTEHQAEAGVKAGREGILEESPEMEGMICKEVQVSIPSILFWGAQVVLRSLQNLIIQRVDLRSAKWSAEANLNHVTSKALKGHIGSVPESNSTINRQHLAEYHV
ncbi:hypothetical protein R1sor_014751 [Riccia sorocarpa]|uniref:Uncharacterized protein n=1 Tax=Riccia sorocarpa TaxID=122646 RepID=A0ABD3HAA1_9MARC